MIPSYIILKEWENYNYHVTGIANSNPNPNSSAKYIKRYTKIFASVSLEWKKG
jgi:hypothetical protein